MAHSPSAAVDEHHDWQRRRRGGAVAVQVELERAVSLPALRTRSALSTSSMGCHSTAMLTAKQVTRPPRRSTTPRRERADHADLRDVPRCRHRGRLPDLDGGHRAEAQGRPHREGPQDRAHVEGMRSLTGATEPDYGTMFDNWFVARGQPYLEPDEPAARRGGAGLRAPRAAGRSPRQRRGRHPGHRFRAAVHGDRRHPSEGPGADPLVDSIADAAACGLVVLGGTAGPAHRHRHPPRRRQPVDQRQHGGERRRVGGDGQPDQRGGVAGQQAPRVRRRRSRPATSSCRARSSRPSRSSRATRWWRCSTRSARSRSTPSAGTKQRPCATASRSATPTSATTRASSRSSPRRSRAPASTTSLAAEHVIGGHPDRADGREGAHLRRALPRAVRAVRLPRRGHRAPRAGDQHPDPPAAPDRARGQAGGRARPAHRRAARLGVGVGRNWMEYEALNEDFTNRGARIEEQVEVLRRLWTEELVTFDGTWHHLDRMGLNPMPRAAADPDLDGLVRR